MQEQGKTRSPIPITEPNAEPAILAMDHKKQNFFTRKKTKA